MDSGLTVHVGEDLEQLADRFATLLREPRSHVLAPDWTVVPSAPIRQWLDWTVASRVGTSDPKRTDGVTANLRYLFPQEFVTEIERLTLADLGVEWRSWDVDTLTVQLLQRAATAGSYERAHRLGEEIDELVRWRPDYVRSRTEAPVASRETLRAYDALGTEAERPLGQRDVVRAALRRARPATLPDRLVIFGLANVPGGPEFVRLIHDLATHVAVHVLMPVVDVEHVRARVHDGAVASTTGVLESWFRESRECIELWCDVAADASQWEFLVPHRIAPTSALGALQATLRTGQLARSDLDDSVLVIGAVGVTRQVEVLRDVLLEAIHDDDVAPHEILVVTPDPTVVADALERHWDYEAHDAPGALPRLPYELTEVDSSVAKNRLRGSLALLDLLGNYATAEQIQQICSFPTFAGAMNLATSQWDRLWRLVHDAAVTLGVSPAQRRSFDVYAQSNDEFRADAGTWERLIDRVMTSVNTPATFDEASAALGVPDDLVVLAALHPLLRLLDEHASIRTESPRALDQWLDDLESWMAIVAAERSSDDSFARAVVRARQWSLATSAPNEVAVLTFGEFLSLWREMAVSGSQQRVFGRFGVTVTRLTSMAYAPYRIICLVGFDESNLPASALESPVLGTRLLGDPDARHSLLGAVLAATVSARQRLIVTWSNRRDDDGRPVNPPIALDELVDAVTTVTSAPRAAVHRSSSRHGYSVTRGDESVVTTTYDRRYSDLDRSISLVPVAVAKPDQPDGDVSYAELHRFLGGPVNYFVRHTLSALTPPEGFPEVVVPPVALDALRRSSLQRAYVHGLAGELHHLFARSPESVPPFEQFDHDCDAECSDLPCEWLHGPAFSMQQTLLNSERHNANVPARLWSHRMQFNLLNLAAYNFALDRFDFEPIDDELRANLTTNIDVDATTRLTLTSAETPTPFDCYRFVREPHVLTTVTFEPRSGDLRSWRNVLGGLLELLVLTINAPLLGARVTVEFMPVKAGPYGRGTDEIAKGEFARSPRGTLRFTGTVGDAHDALAALIRMYRVSLTTVPGLFRRTSVAAVATGLGAKPRDQWESNPPRFGEDREVAHRLLFPLNYDDLEILEDGHFPFQSELSVLFAHVEFQMVSQSKRSAPVVLQDLDPDRWRDASVDVAFRRLGDELRGES